ncbi:hypothetical protein [Vannielia litorea]|uniref:ATP-grasp domain-containing protein n=1 Tax=Vannielia litorea TaxID=1217970 RepID=A0A1N6GHX6_9RHOB|nr:hypothetical protein [Vannielia litorea]SIO07061.1 hypothetical protein SAMN05444002_2494 [Vannielia litorea]
MIVVLVSDMNRWPMTRLLRTARGRLPPISLVDYQTAFRRLSVPAGSLVFTDFDLLSSFEMDAAGRLATAAARQGLRVLNHPVRVMERHELLASLHAQGLNPVQVTRLEAGGRPTRFPLFIRQEDGCLRPDTGLIENDVALDAALAGLRRAGKTMKRRIAVSFENLRDEEGFFRKYGAFCIGGRIVPQHILRDRDWIVKSHRAPDSARFAEEELDWVRSNPHAAELARIFAHAGIDFGRIDYAVVEGRIVTFEINVNPTFPRFRGGNPAREARRGPILAALAEAFAEVDTADARGRLRFQPDPDGARYIKRKRWNRIERQMWKLRMALRDRRGDE